MFNLVKFTTVRGENIAINPDQVASCISAGDNTDILTVTGVLYRVRTQWTQVVIMLERGY